MSEAITKKTPKSCCRNCMFALSVVGAPDDVRCGVSYYKQAPVERHVLPLRVYPQVDPAGICDLWQLTLRLVDV